VASGDPTQDQVVIWTRLSSGDGEPPPVSWTVATDPQLSDVVASGAAVADPDANLTLHAEVEGLRPGTTYHYAFETLGDRSPIARTRTLPPDGADHLRIAMVSCAKYAAGFFNGYGRIAERDDLTSCCISATRSTRSRTARPRRRPSGPTSGVPTRRTTNASI